MTAKCLLDAEGRAVYVNGYACVWNTLSNPVTELDNRRCLFLPTAFRDVLKRPLNSIKCEVDHAGPGAVIGSTRDANLEIWSDSFGLAFQAGPLPATATAISTARSIIQGQARGASTRDVVAEQKIEMIDGEEVIVVHRVKSLLHLGPVYVPQNPYTAVWLSTEDPYDMPPRIKALAELWAADKPRHDTRATLRKVARAVSRLTPKATARKPTARARPAAAPMAMHDIYPAGLGFSSAELGRLAILDTTARRAMKAVEALRLERQRETNRARRRDRRAA